MHALISHSIAHYACAPRELPRTSSKPSGTSVTSAWLAAKSRSMPAPSSGVRIERAEGSPRAVIWLEREPVNSMTLEFWRALSGALDALERDDTVRERYARGTFER